MNPFYTLIIVSTGSFQTILESMQSMMNGLRMIWVISRHYNCEERMAPLMETIANTLVRQPTLPYLSIDVSNLN